MLVDASRQSATVTLDMNPNPTFSEASNNQRHCRGNRPVRHHHTGSEATGSRTDQPCSQQKASPAERYARWTACISLLAALILFIRVLLPIGHTSAPPVVNYYEINNGVVEQLIIGSDMPAATGRKER